MKNWRTTAAGIALVLFALYQVALLATGEGNADSVYQAILAALAAFGLVNAKDSGTPEVVVPVATVRHSEPPHFS